ncbi:hypothetical protein [Methylobacter sp. BBA5.1]|uniref:hypothetical protein n=1 Tax=Methylobacter sp. BBA5.1 TaxID=1495064 RepID=UPI00126805C6|nr:hypothetical protein [Methylobacter sp. BBA5.1]
MESTEILSYLNSLGFIDTGKKGFGGHHRVIHPNINKGSLYVGNQYISGTGAYVELKNHIPQSSFDNHDYPEWRNSTTEALLDCLASWIK